jgi:hypothetical protein
VEKETPSDDLKARNKKRKEMAQRWQETHYKNRPEVELAIKEEPHG